MVTDKERADLVILSHIKDTTLDGAPAMVVGSKNPFAKVVKIDGSGGAVEFSWETVKRIMNRDRKFKS